MLSSIVLAISLTHGCTAEIDMPHATAGDYEVLGVVPFMDNGPTDNRVDVVVLAEGFQAHELDEFVAVAGERMGDLFLHEPYATYAHAFNVWLVLVTSVESGVSQYQEPPMNTAFGAYFFSGPSGGLTCDWNETWVAAAAAPAVDQIIVLCNTTQYGGAGFVDACTATAYHFWSNHLVTHEFGHSFGDLGDEYVRNPPSTWTGGALGYRNVSHLDAVDMAAAQAKWYLWLGYEDPILGAVGAYEGNWYHWFGLWRATNESAMRVTHRKDFSPPQQESIIEQMYVWVDPIEAHAPLDVLERSSTAWIEPLVPVSVEWRLDGVLVAHSQNSLWLGALDVSEGQHTLTCQVVDANPLVRDYTLRAESMVQSASWQVSAELADPPSSIVPGALNTSARVMFDIRGRRVSDPKHAPSGVYVVREGRKITQIVRVK